MKGELSFGIDENGHFFYVSGTQRYSTEVEPTEKEAQALAQILAAVDAPVKFYRRSNDYLTICNEAGNDFCRLKAADKVLWFSLDMWTNKVHDRPSLDRVGNKKQRHWKIKVDSIEEISLFADVIAEAAK